MCAYSFVYAYGAFLALQILASNVFFLFLLSGEWSGHRGGVICIYLFSRGCVWICLHLHPAFSPVATWFLSPQTILAPSSETWGRWRHHTHAHSNLRAEIVVGNIVKRLFRGYDMLRFEACRCFITLWSLIDCRQISLKAVSVIVVVWES